MNGISNVSVLEGLAKSEDVTEIFIVINFSLRFQAKFLVGLECSCGSKGYLCVGEDYKMKKEADHAEKRVSLWDGTDERMPAVNNANPCKRLTRQLWYRCSAL